MSTKQASSGKKVSKKETKSEQPATVVAAAATPAPAVQAQQGGDAKSAKRSAAAPAKKAVAQPAKKAAVAAPVAAPAPAVVPAKKAAAAKKAVGGAKKAAAAAPAKRAAATAAPAKTEKAASTKKAVVAPTAAAEPVAEDDPRTRYFKVIVDGGDAHGRFSGSKPKQAANKALTSILKTREQTGGGVSGEIKFSIVECTRGSKHKQYNYVGQRVKLDKPMKVKIGNGPNAKEIEYKFNNRVMKDKQVVVQA